MNLRHNIGHDISQQIILVMDMHHQPDYQGSNQRIQRTHNDKTEYTDRFFHAQL